MAQSSDLQSEAEFRSKVAAIKSSFGLLSNRSEVCLSTIDTKPSVYKLERYLNMCQNKSAFLKKKKEDGYFGAFCDHLELSEIEKSLEETISKLQASKKELEDKGYTNDKDLILNDAYNELPPETLQLLHQFFERT